MKNWILSVCLAAASLGYGEEKSEKGEKIVEQDAMTPEKVVVLLGQASGAEESLSSAIRHLTADITHPYFGEEFLAKVAAAEKGGATGEYVEYWQNGQIKAKGSFKKGRPDGHIHGWYENGTDAFKAFFKEGVRLGVHLAFFPPEVTKVSRCPNRIWVYNEEGKLTGDQKLCFNEGSLRALVSYKDGVLDGKVAVWKEPSKKMNEWEYRNGKKKTGK